MQNLLPQQQPFNSYRPMQMFYKALPVTSEAEMNTYTVDFNGMPTYFHNQATNEIYVKQFDIRTGLTTTQKFIKFEPDSKPNNESKDADNINLYKEELNAIYSKLDGLEERFKKLTVNNNQDIKGAKNAK